METNEKVFLSTQLLAVLPPIACKMALFLVNWQNSPKGIMLYEHRFAKTLKMSELEVRICIQTLIDLKLIDLTSIDGKWRIEFNPSEWQKYYKIPMERVIEHKGYELAKRVTYDKVEKESPSVTSEMSTEQLQKMILLMQAQLEERKQVKELVKSNDDYDDNLPF